MTESPENASQFCQSELPPEMLNACYGEMRRMARRIMGGNPLCRVLQPTELANEAAIRLIRANLENVKDQGHLLAVAARLMRQLLVDEARRGLSYKRCGPTVMTLWPDDGARAMVDFGDLDIALTALAALSPARAAIVELRFILGMTVEETAAATGISERSVKRQWQAARAWLLAHLNGETFADIA